MIDDLYISEGKQKGHKTVDGMFLKFCDYNIKKLECMSKDAIVPIEDFDSSRGLLVAHPFFVRWIGKLGLSEGNSQFVFLDRRMDKVFYVDYLGARDRH